MTSSTLAIGTSYYLLPKTSHNIQAQLERVEKNYPHVLAVHEKINESVFCVRKEVDNTVAQLRGAVDENANKLRQQIQENTDKVKSQVNSAVGSTSTEAKDKFDEVKKNVESMYSTRSNVSCIKKMTFICMLYN